MKTKLTVSLLALTLFLSSCAKETFFFSNTGTTYGSKKAASETLAAPEATSTEAVVAQEPAETAEVYLAATNKAATVSKKELTKTKALYHGTAHKADVSKAVQVKAAVKANKEIKKLVKQAQKNSMPAVKAEGKSQVTALILAGLVGVLGVHRFYLGYTGIAIAQLLTLGGCGIWSLIDLVRIITGDLKPKDGDYTKTL